MKKSKITLKRTQTAVGRMANQLVMEQKAMSQEHSRAGFCSYPASVIRTQRLRL